MLEQLGYLALGGLGSLILWLTVGGKIVRRNGFLALADGIEAAYDDPESKEAEVIAKIANVGMRQIVSQIDAAFPENLKEPVNPMINKIFRRMERHVMGSVNLAFGRFIRRIEEKAPQIAKELGFGGITDIGDIIGNFMGEDTQFLEVIPQLGKLSKLTSADGNGFPINTAAGSSW